MLQMVSEEWLLLALERGDVPDAAATSSARGIRWQTARRSVQAHALDEETLLATFLEHAGRAGSASNVIRRYRASPPDLERFLEDVRAFFDVAVGEAYG